MSEWRMNDSDTSLDMSGTIKQMLPQDRHEALDHTSYWRPKAWTITAFNNDEREPLNVEQILEEEAEINVSTCKEMFFSFGLGGELANTGKNSNCFAWYWDSCGCKFPPFVEWRSDNITGTERWGSWWREGRKRRARDGGASWDRWGRAAGGGGKDRDNSTNVHPSVPLFT